MGLEPLHYAMWTKPNKPVRGLNRPIPGRTCCIFALNFTSEFGSRAIVEPGPGVGCRMHSDALIMSQIEARGTNAAHNRSETPFTAVELRCGHDYWHRRMQNQRRGCQVWSCFVASKHVGEVRDYAAGSTVYRRLPAEGCGVELVVGHNALVVATGRKHDE